ncbi:MAG: tetratricopeptide repeat protein [Prolixibacteraceae bacterium]|nr:tetratricopeptide repeat protein [Prolixibacteraceae bacterium]
MNNFNTKYFLFLCLLAIGFSCQNRSERAEKTLGKAEMVVDTLPDSALVMLNTIQNPQRLNKPLYYDYLLLRVRAKDKSFKDIAQDTLIFKVKDYYVHKKNVEKIFMSTFYCGRVLREQGKFGEALETFLSAEPYLDKSKNINLKGLLQGSIGEIYYQQLLKEKAFIHFKRALSFFHQANNFRNEIIECNYIGNCYLLEEKSDSAIVYYFRALALADRLQFTGEQAGIRESIGVAYRENRDFKNSEEYFKEAWKFSVDSLRKARLSSNLAILFEYQGKNDSAISFLQKALSYLPSDKENFLSANIYKTWSAVEENKMNFEGALEKYKIYNKYLASILNDNKNSAVLEIEGKYNYQRVENYNKQLLIERQKILLYFLVVLIVFMLSFLVVLRRSYVNVKKLKEAETKIYHMKELARNFNENEDSFRSILLRHFNILKKTALLEGNLNEAEKGKGKKLLRKFNEVVYGSKELEWGVLYQALDKLHNGFFERLKREFPHLDESEFRICCLAYDEFDNTEMAIVLNYSINTIQAKKSAIRKKLGIRSYGDIRDFLLRGAKNISPLSTTTE